MTYNWNRIAQFAAIGACCSLVVRIGSTSAKEEETSVLVKKPVATVEQGPALPPPSNPTKDVSSSKVVTPPQPAVPPAAKQQSTTTAKRPFMRPAVPRNPGRGSLTANEEPMPPPANQPLPAPGDQAAPPAETTGVHVQPTPPIEYDTDHDARRMYRTGQVELVMLTQNPADGCLYEIPLCVPGCCVGEPTVSAGRGIFGRGVVEYCWSCGFKAEVKFRQILGDVKVEYEGD